MHSHKYRGDSLDTGGSLLSLPSNVLLPILPRHRHGINLLAHHNAGASALVGGNQRCHTL